MANVVQVEATSFDVIVDRSEVGSGWATETAPTTETATPVIERISIKLHELAAMPKASQRLLDDSAFDVEGWLAEKIATRFTRAEASAFINGDGVDKPKGILLPTKVANASWTWGNIGYVPDGRGGGFRRPPIRRTASSTWSMRWARTTGRTALRDELEDRGRGAQDEGRRRPLPVVGRAGGGRARAADGLSGAVAEDMPDIAANAYAIAFGDFRRPIPSRNARTCGSCAIRSRPSRMSCSTPTSAWAATSPTMRRSSC
jgi:predicted phage gp36 major capsid-like protein